ncbi:MAG TPA: CehA/McbA family metallohydrolase [Xanthomonadales bacterium]|nr:CehA/McbA family metallohydrolase [Xanthomonadales bacterium]
MRMIPSLTLLLFLSSFSVHGQWTNQYPLAQGFDHQVYLEGFELPVLNSGPTDPAPSPTGLDIAFAAKGWLWLLDPESGHARRITQSRDMDSRPEWSADGKTLVFIRDSGSTLNIVSLDLESGKERVLVDVEAINLDPVFSADGNFVYYASAEGGPLRLWRVSVDSLQREEVTTFTEVPPRPIQRRPVLRGDGGSIVYLNKQGSYDSINLLDTQTNSITTLVDDRITAQADFSLSPDGNYLAYTWPFDGGWELRLLAVDTPNTSVLLTHSLGLPLAPAFSRDGEWIYFTESNDDERSELKRVSVKGGPVEIITINNFDWGEPTGRLVIRSEVDGEASAVRLNVMDESGHPVIPETGAVRFEGQHGRVFFYSKGEIELIAPAGKVSISAVQGFETAELLEEAIVRPDAVTQVTLGMRRIWDASANGWYAGDNHFHLNYGGSYRLEPQDIVLDMQGEGLDVAYPLLANLHNRFLQQDLWGTEYSEGTIIRFGQEVRSHFLGHLQLLGTRDLFWPWVWGPGYQVYGKDDRLNATALRHARAQGGLGGYVHPVGDPDPFTLETAANVPLALVADAVLGEVDVIELSCLWTNETGTAALWHQVLNLGIPLAASAGSDVMNNYYRTMAVGATRVYVKPETELTDDSYLQALKAGRSFVSNGPLLEFKAGGAEPGQVIAAGGAVEWTLNVHSASPYTSVQIFVNGSALQTLDGSTQSGSHSYSGSVQVPSGGWITARVAGPNSGWPALDSYLFAETSPIWFGAVGSTEPAAMRQAAAKLLMILDVSEQNLREGYGESPIPNLLAHFALARERLESLVGDEMPGTE